jgi:cysteine desulfurase family protein (TIGR01976 family)
MARLDPLKLRQQFPALSLKVNGQPAVYFDGPGGTQVPQRVIDAVTRYYSEMNSNDGGAFLTSRHSDAMLIEARTALADLLNAPGPDQIKFSQNMTTHTFNISRAFGKNLSSGDEVVVTTLDHDANVSTWRALEERGVTLRTVGIHEADCTLDMADLEAKLNAHTRLVAIGYASNAVGTLNDVRAAVDMAHAAGALAYVDAVHYTPHGPIDVQALDCDFLVCSVYKFFGPHLGVLYGKPEAFDRLAAYKVRPAHDRFETGTQNHEGIAGALAAVEYLAEIGRTYGSEFAGRWPSFSGRRLELKQALSACQAYERELGQQLLAGLLQIPGLKVWGITDAGGWERRVPTVSFTLAGYTPRQVAEHLGEQGIFVWDGDFFALGLIERLGLAESGGMVRVGLVHYNTAEEVERLLAAVAGLARAKH